jgi:hypothetical protein
LAYRDDAGRVADFHAFRHTFISNLIAGGVHPKTAQQLARHGSIGLTMDRYTHVYRGDLATALNVLPNLSTPIGVAILKTGTDDQAAGRVSPGVSPESGKRSVGGADTAAEGDCLAPKEKPAKPWYSKVSRAIAER